MVGSALVLSMAVIFGGSSVLTSEQRSSSTHLAHRTTAKSPNHTSEAYVSLVYGDYYNWLGVRVLGQSLLDTGTAKDRVALCTNTVSDETKELLQADGWIIKPVSTINPYSKRRSDYYFSAYSKLHVWNMTEYERVVYLDSDVLVLTNIDHLFDCGTFCAAYEVLYYIFNSGVMVVEPSTTVFNDMMRKVSTLKSYDHADQGFLNAYFEDLLHAPFFNCPRPQRDFTPLACSLLV